jgi:hypothetical protein
VPSDAKSKRHGFHGFCSADPVAFLPGLDPFKARACPRGHKIAAWEERRDCRLFTTGCLGTIYFFDRIDSSSGTLASMKTSGLPTRLMTKGQCGVLAGIKK